MSVYAGSSLCAGAKQELARRGIRVADVRLRVVCVDDRGRRGESRLAAIGAAARRATEDSSSVAYFGTKDPTATRFSTPILEEAGIARISTSSGAAATVKLLGAMARVDDRGALRESLYDELR